MEAAQPAISGNHKARNPGTRELALPGHHHTGMRAPSCQASAALARRDRQGQTLGDVLHEALVSGHEALVRSTGGAVFVTYGTLDLPGIGTVFYVIFSDAPLARGPEWVLILTWTSWAGRSDILETADRGRRLLRALAN